MQLIICSRDLAVGSAATAITKATGAACTIAMTLDRARTEVEKCGLPIVVLDLESLPLETSIIHELRAAMPASGILAAFGPHVHHDRLAKARESGCDPVWTKGHWQQGLAQLLQSRHAALLPDTGNQGKQDT